ncbi:MAG: hypothetical protein ACXAEN_17540, partial [Candidatus Thorarchaeota archaeon]
MTREGREYSGRRREGQNESAEGYDREELQKMIDEYRKENEEQEREEAEAPEQNESNQEVSKKRELPEDPEQSIKDAIKEIELEEAERRKAYEEYEERLRQKRESLERSREERLETADKDNLDEYEKKVLDEFEKRGLDSEELERRWRERYVEEVKEEQSESEPETEQDEDDKDDEQSSRWKTPDGYSYYTDESGQIYAVKTESKESDESKSDQESEGSLEKSEVESIQEIDNETESRGDAGEAQIERKRTRQEHEDSVENQLSEIEETGEKNDVDRPLENGSKETSEQTSEDSSERKGHPKEDTLKTETQEKARVKESSKNTETREIEGQEIADEEDDRLEKVTHEHSVNEVEENKESNLDDELSTKIKNESESSELHRAESDNEYAEGNESTKQDHSTEIERSDVDPPKEDTSFQESEEINEIETNENREEEGDWTHAPGQRSGPFGTSLFETSREREWREYIRELFEELPDEMKEEFRKLIRENLTTEEDLMRLLRDLGLEWMADETRLEESRKYLWFKQLVRERGEEQIEEIAKELGIDKEIAQNWKNELSRPRMISRVLNDFGEKMWSGYIKTQSELNLPKNFEEVKNEVREHPELLEIPHFQQKMKDVEKWLEIMNLKEEGKLDVIFTDGKELFRLSQIHKLSMSFGISEDLILDWLRRKIRPPLLDQMANKKRIDASFEGPVDTHPVLRMIEGIQQTMHYAKWLEQGVEGGYDDAMHSSRQKYALLDIFLTMISRLYTSEGDSEHESAASFLQKVQNVYESSHQEDPLISTKRFLDHHRVRVLESRVNMAVQDVESGWFQDITKPLSPKGEGLTSLVQQIVNFLLQNEQANIAKYQGLSEAPNIQCIIDDFVEKLQYVMNDVLKDISEHSHPIDVHILVNPGSRYPIVWVNGKEFRHPNSSNTSRIATPFGVLLRPVLVSVKITGSGMTGTTIGIRKLSDDVWSLFKSSIKQDSEITIPAAWRYVKDSLLKASCTEKGNLRRSSKQQIKAYFEGWPEHFLKAALLLSLFAEGD